jgi:hypothetical protein
MLMKFVSDLRQVGGFTKPIFSMWWTEPVFVIIPVSCEIYRPIESLLNNLKNVILQHDKGYGYGVSRRFQQYVSYIV